MDAPAIHIDPIKYIQNLEEFNGHYKNLYTFITLVDRINPFIQVYAAPAQQILVDLIKSRIKGRAREVIEINCQATTWPEIKEVLLNNFGERRTCEELFEELRSTSFITNSVDFFNDIKHKLRDLNNKTLIVLGSNEAARATCENNMRTALNTFKAKMPEPMKTILMCRNPSTLEEAIDILFQSGYANLNPFASNSNAPTHSSSNRNRASSNRNQAYNQHQNGYTFYPNQGNTRPFNGQYNPRFGNNSNVTNNRIRPNVQANFQNGQNYPHNPFNANMPYVQNYAQQQIRQPQFNNPNNFQPRPEPMDINNNEFEQAQNLQLAQTSQNFSLTGLQRKLPYIEVKTKLATLKFIIDTGATNSIINPGLCHPRHKVPTEPLVAKTLQHYIYITEKVRIPLFSELGDTSNFIEMYICQFHDYYDGLIGIDILTQLKAIIDFQSNVLKSGNNTIPLLFDENSIIQYQNYVEEIEVLLNTFGISENFLHNF